MVLWWLWQGHGGEWQLWCSGGGGGRVVAVVTEGVEAAGRWC